LEQMNNARPITAALAVLATLLVGALGAVPVSASLGQANGTVNLFIRSASENADQSQVTFPLHRGTSHGGSVYYVVTEASDRGVANAMGVNYAPKLEAAKGTAAVETVSLNADGSIDFPASVDFSPVRTVVAGATGFPPASATYGAAGETGYSPLIELPDGTVLNAAQIARGTAAQIADGATDPSAHRADKVISISSDERSVVYSETEGRYDNRVVHYVSFDSSFAGAAALEDVTYAPALDSAPSAGCADPVGASSPCAREPLIAFTNGQTGVTNPNRQGLSSAILDGLSPLNILDEIPEGQADPGFPVYSPLWDIHLAQWSAAAVASGQNVRQADFMTAYDLSTPGGPVSSFDSGAQPLHASGFIVNCPAVSMNPSH
jgi:hypothetical protein